MYIRRLRECVSFLQLRYYYYDATILVYIIRTKKYVILNVTRYKY